MSSKTKILLVHSGNESFVRLDLELLQKSFSVNEFYAQKKLPYNVRGLWAAIQKTDILFCWFASWNSFLALLLSKLFRKPSILVIGGYDVANLPEADYGHQRGGLKKYVSCWAMNLAALLLPFSFYSQQEAEQNASISVKRMKVVYIGVPDPLGRLLETPRARMALTVGKVEWPNLKRKGLESFVRAAGRLPDVQFVLVGAWADESIDYLRSIASSNVIFTGRVTDEELLGYYQQASIYVQASLHEGFGMSVAEAMLAGCIPVVTRAGSLPEVVGDCGFYSDSPEPLDIAEAIEKALESSGSIRARARERILSNFPLEKRRKLLEEIIWSIFPQRSQVR